MIVTALLIVVSAGFTLGYGGAAAVQQGTLFSLLGGEHVNPQGESSVSSKGLGFDLQTQQFRQLADSGVDRSKHTVVEHEGNWYIYGGQSQEVQTHDPETGDYTLCGQRHGTPGLPPARVGHTAVAFRNKMYVLGGELADGSVDGSLWEFDLVSESWRQLTSVLNSITEHSAIVKDGVMWVYGGRDRHGSVSGDLWTYDLVSGRWMQAEVFADGKHAPTPRFGHSAVLVENEILFFGGVNAQRRYLNDVWALHADVRERAAPSWMRAAVVDSGTAPAPRAHSAVAHYDNALWFFGGRDASQTYLDIWALDLEFLQWELIGCFPGVAFPQCREAAIKMDPPASQALSSFRFVNPGVSEATYSVQLHSAPSHPVHVIPDVDAGHVQVTPSELVFDEDNWSIPQVVRVLVLEDLFLPGDASDLTITHETRTLDQHYKRSILEPRAVAVPSICGDGRCMGDENHVNCHQDCRNSGAASFCGDGMCNDSESWQSCPEDCSVQGSDNSCPHENPIRCRSGECVHDAAQCTVRSRSTSKTCFLDDGCTGAVLTCPTGHTLCSDGSCAETTTDCPVLEPCGRGKKRCFDTSCRVDCEDANGRCPPAQRNLDLMSGLCGGDPMKEVTIEMADRAIATLSTIHRPRSSTSRLYLLANDGHAYYGQIAFPGGSFDERTGSSCPCETEPAAPSNADPMVGVKVEPTDDIPEGAFGGFKLTLPAGASGDFSPHLASVWISHSRTDIDQYCLGAHTEHGWICVDENLVTSGDTACECTAKHTRGTFGRNYERFAFIRDNCPGMDNASQSDMDMDGAGDMCDEEPMVPGGHVDLSCGDDSNKAYIESIKSEINLPESGIDCPANEYL